MSLKIVTADERLAQPPKINIALFGPSGAGKTFQAQTLPEETTLFIDLEAGTLALQGWKGDVIDIRRQAEAVGAHPWELARAIACLLCGPDPAAPKDSPYSRDWYAKYTELLGAREELFGKYTTVFVDSITVASRLAFSWAKTQPQALSEKTGKPDNRGAYGLLGQEMVAWLTTLQHIPGMSVIVVGILDRMKDDFGRITWEPQIEGSKAGRELPGIFDEVVSLGLFSQTDEGGLAFAPDGGKHRAFVCHQNNGFGLPAKDRSGRLDDIERPDLGALMRKIAEGNRIDTIQTELPETGGNQQ